jgi:hypothetical protein
MSETEKLLIFAVAVAVVIAFVIFPLTAKWWNKRRLDEISKIEKK